MPVFFLKFFLCFACSLLVLSCQPQPEPPPVDQSSEDDEANNPRNRRDRGNRYRRTRPGDDARTRRHTCRNYGEQSDYICDGDDDCMDACDDLFPVRKYEAECLKLPAELVYDIEALLLQMDDGDADDIDAGTLHCLLNINDQKFLNELNGLSSREGKDFLQQIASDEDLADTIAEHDDDYTILERIMEAAFGESNSDGLKGFTRDVTSDLTFLDLILNAENESAFGWVDGYIDDFCDNHDSLCQYSQNRKDAFKGYCRIYHGKLGSDTNRSWRYLKTSSLFKELYEDRITDRNCPNPSNTSGNSCEYEKRADFKAVCEDVYGATSGP